MVVYKAFNLNISWCKRAQGHPVLLLKECVVRHVPELLLILKGKKSKMLIIGDNLASHISLMVINLSRENEPSPNLGKAMALGCGGYSPP
jgi:hypothetical protein